jgi:DNA-binding IclR family transcriptional regulator
MSGRTYHVSVLDRGITVLKAFTHANPNLSLSEIARITGLPLSTCLRLLSTLRMHGLVSREGDSGRYRLGYELLAMAEIAGSQGGLVDWATPVMNDLVARHKETVVLSVRAGDHRIDLKQVIGQHPVRRVIAIGEQKPLYAGAASHVLLAALAAEELDAYLARVDLIQLAEQTITDRDVLRARLDRVREARVAVSVQEQSDGGGAGVAAPIVDARDDVTAALGFSVPQFRFTPALRTQLAVAIVAGAERISATLGGKGRKSA